MPERPGAGRGMSYPRGGVTFTEILVWASPRSMRAFQLERRGGRRSPGTARTDRYWDSSGWSGFPGRACCSKHTSCRLVWERSMAPKVTIPGRQLFGAQADWTKTVRSPDETLRSTEADAGELLGFEGSAGGDTPRQPRNTANSGGTMMTGWTK